MLAEAVHHEPLPTPEALKIYVNRSLDYLVFAVEIRSWRWLRENFPDLRIAPRLAVGRDTTSGVELQIHETAAQLVALLIGAPAEHLARLGVQAIHFLDVDSEEIIERMDLTSCFSGHQRLSPSTRSDSALL